MAFDRRTLLRSTALVGAGAVLEGCREPAKPAGEQTPAPPGPPRELLDVVTAVAERILPQDGDGPGAKEAGVGAFLARALADPRLAHLLPLLKAGARVLDGAAAGDGAASFTAAAAEQQDELLARLLDGRLQASGFDGSTFLRVMVALTLEGFLGDPRHGGNQGGAAWAWLGYSPLGRNGGAHP